MCAKFRLFGFLSFFLLLGGDCTELDGSSSSSSHLSSSVVTSFYIKPGQEHTERVSYEDYSCVFAYCAFTEGVRPPKPSVVEPLSESGETAKQISENLFKKYSVYPCFSLVSGWNYELCLKGQITQRQGIQQYELGIYRGVNEKGHFLFDGGTPCPARSDLLSGRRSSVVLACSNSGKVTLASVFESSTCEYIFILRIPDVCDHPLFPDVADFAGKSDAGTAGSHQVWSLSIEVWHAHTHGLDEEVPPAYMECRARYVSGNDMDESFSDFALTLWEGDLPREIDHTDARVRNGRALSLSSLSAIDGGYQAASLEGDRACIRLLSVGTHL